MFKINLSKLSDFDTQVITLIELSPGSWRIGSAPTLICHHEQLGWFHRHWIFGVQPLINTPGSTRLRSLTWRGQILLRRKIREIKRSAIDLNVPEAIAPVPTDGRSNVPRAGGVAAALGGGSMTAAGMQAMQAQQNAFIQRAAQQLSQTVDQHVLDTLSNKAASQQAMRNDMADALKFQLRGMDMAAPSMPTPPKPYQVIQMDEPGDHM